MIDINIVQNGLAILVTFITAEAGVVAWFYKTVFKEINKLKITSADHEEEIQCSKQERRLSIEVQRTILEVVARNKNNGNVEAAMDKIDNFLNDQAHK